ncbi:MULTISPECIES: hypothetical protein [unclassified Dysgonomonas]|uniref:hypothetical protein n=1 Tax=unclassified Dysgonomonas TaxID=2630389 RepID=UPI0013EE39AE|nr:MULTISPECIES: hypothetical protein [unclassified Dysgonomonas]
MKRLLYIFLFLLGLQNIRAQDVVNDTIRLQKTDIVGRWVEAKRIVNDSIIIEQAFPDHYIFKDDMVFHKGQASEGVILFNIGGRYRIEGDSIAVTYFDFIQNTTDSRVPQTVTFKVVSLSESEINAYVNDSQEGKYFIRLRRQFLDQ